MDREQVARELVKVARELVGERGRKVAKAPNIYGVVEGYLKRPPKNYKRALDDIYETLFDILDLIEPAMKEFNRKVKPLYETMAGWQITLDGRPFDKRAKKEWEKARAEVQKYREELDGLDSLQAHIERVARGMQRGRINLDRKFLSIARDIAQKVDRLGL